MFHDDPRVFTIDGQPIRVLPNLQSPQTVTLRVGPADGFPEIALHTLPAVDAAALAAELLEAVAHCARVQHGVPR